MNESRSYLSESDPKNRMTKRSLKEMKITTYTNKVHIFFGGLIIGTP